MLCDKCGKESSDKQNFCGYCGKEFTLVKKEKQEKEKQEQIENGTVRELIKNLDKDDYTILEAHHTDNHNLLLRIGAFDQLKRYLKLLRCGLVKKLDRELTLKEKEKLEKFKNSPQFKQYVIQMQRLDSTELRNGLKEYKNKFGLKNDDDPIDITERGKEILSNIRKKVEKIWQDLKSSYDKKDKKEFREKVDKNMSMFPLFMVMGFVNGTMMGTMMGNMGMDSQMYMQDMDMAYNDGYADGSGDYGGEYDSSTVEDGAGGEGGFMDGGFDVGF